MDSDRNCTVFDISAHADSVALNSKDELIYLSRYRLGYKSLMEKIPKSKPARIIHGEANILWGRW